MAITPTATPEVLVAVERVSAELRALLSVLDSPTAADIAAVESAGRLMDAARVRSVAPLSRSPLAAEQLGYATAVAAVASIAQISERSARARLCIAAGVTPDVSISGAPLPAAHGLLSQALDRGAVGLDAAALIVRELDAVITRVAPEVVAAAETVMVNLACARDASGEHAVLPVSIDYLAGELRQIGAAIDPDGALPRETRARRRRAFRIGAQDEDGLFPVSGRLLPEVALLATGLVEALRRSPRFVAPDELDGSATGTAAGDSRTADQRRHDAFGEILTAAAAGAGAPQLDGQPVTVVVTVTGDKYDNSNGLAGDSIGIMAGSRFPVSRAELERFVDAGGFRRVFTTTGGRVTGISSPQRCFTPAQRLGIAARDGYECFTPGCTSKHIALQAHHVVPVREHGPTTIDNGILLCFDHHRQVDTGPWEYRMVDGLPEVRGPGVPQWARRRSGLGRAA